MGVKICLFWLKIEVWDKYDSIWDVIKDKLGFKFHSEPGVIKPNFLNNGMLKENMYYSCITCITIDSLMNFDKKNHPQVYLEECKYRITKTQMPKFIKNKLKLDSDSDLGLNLNLDSEVSQNPMLNLILILILIMVLEKTLEVT